MTNPADCVGKAKVFAQGIGDVWLCWNRFVFAVLKPTVSARIFRLLVVLR